MFFVLSVFTGLMVALMTQLNGVLQIALGGKAALLSIHLCGLAGALVFWFLARRKMTGDPAQKVPPVYLAAGMLGTLLVYLVNVVFEKGGILLSLSGNLAGQTLAAALAESLYSKDRESSPLLQRFLSPALLIPGSVIIGLRSGVGPLWILFSWTPGIILMIQQLMNARNTARYGTPRTVVFNYVSALTLMIPLFLAASRLGGTPILGAGGWENLKELPWYVIAGGGLIGVFSTGMIAYLLLKSPALPVTLGIYAGELAGGLFLDLYWGKGFEGTKLLGILLISLGLALGKVPQKRTRPAAY